MKPILLVGEARGEVEARHNSSFIGPSGAELLRMLNESGIISFTFADRDYLHKYYAQSDPSCIEAIWGLHPEVVRTLSPTFIGSHTSISSGGHAT